MGNSVFPTLPGLSWNVKKKPRFSTKIQTAVSGKEARAAFMQSPMWMFELSYDLLRADSMAELQTLCGFFLSRKGAYDSFLYTDPDDYSVTDYQFGTGDAFSTQFQLLRSFGGFVESVQNVNTITNIKKAGVTMNTPADYNVSATGLVTFANIPAGGAALTWTGTYYFRVRFVEDEAELNQFMRQLWDWKSLKLFGALGNKV